MRTTCVDDVRMQMTCACGRCIEQLCIKPTGLLVIILLSCVSRFKTEVMWTDGNILDT